jgi:predicted nucleic acid-binding protein
MPLSPSRNVRIFCDSDVLIAGTASTTGASHILLRLSELTLIDCVTSQYAIREVERNLLAKLPTAIPAFRLILEAALKICPAASSAVEQGVTGQAHTKDVPILAAAIAGQADFLATFNVRHFRLRNTPPIIRQPGAILTQIRSSFSSLLN